MRVLRKIIQHKRKLINGFAVLVFFCMIMVVNYTFIFSKGEDTIINVDPDFGEEIRWNLNTEEVTLPVNIKGKAKGSTFLQTTVPDYVRDDWGVMIHSMYSNIRAYVDDELIYSYGDEPTVPFGQSVGNIKVIIPLNENMVGRKLTIQIMPYYSMNMDIQQPKFGSVAQLKSSVLKENMFAIMLSVFMILIIAFSLALLIYELSARRLKDVELILNFGVFVAFVLIWFICSSNIGQFMTGDAGPVSLLSFLMLASMSVPFAGFCAIALPKGRRFFKIYWLLGILILAVNLICLVAEICDPLILLPVSHVLMVLCVVSAMIFSFQKWKSGTDEKILCIGFVFIGLGAIAGIICYLIAPSMGYAGMAFSFGFFVFFILALWILFRRQAAYIQEAKFIETYNKLAYTDVATNLANRTSFETYFTSLCEDNMSGKALALIIFDVNNLKETNDSIGHQAGDKLIKTAAECINRTFSQYGQCYRLGGDEFAVALTNPAVPVENLLGEFDKAVEYFNKYHAYALSIAYGYVLKPWTIDPNFFRDIYREAQDKMMETKIKMHRESSSEL